MCVYCYYAYIKNMQLHCKKHGKDIGPLGSCDDWISRKAIIAFKKDMKISDLPDGCRWIVPDTYEQLVGKG